MRTAVDFHGDKHRRKHRRPAAENGTFGTGKKGMISALSAWGKKEKWTFRTGKKGSIPALSAMVKKAGFCTFCAGKKDGNAVRVRRTGFIHAAAAALVEFAHDGSIDSPSESQNET